MLQRTLLRRAESSGCGSSSSPQRSSVCPGGYQPVARGFPKIRDRSRYGNEVPTDSLGQSGQKC